MRAGAGVGRGTIRAAAARRATMRAAAATLTFVALAAAPVPAAGAATVSVRIEGDRATLFEGVVATQPRALDGGDGSGAHACPADAAAGPTVGTALADAAAAGGFTWAGAWNPDFRDFFVDRIGPVASRPPTAYWAVLVNGTYALGACREAVRDGDEVLWAYDTNARPVILALAGPASARAGEPVTVTVRDRPAGEPVASARVGGAVTDAAGRAVLRYDTPGPRILKAERSDAVRSNALTIQVEPGAPGADPAEPPPTAREPRTRIVARHGRRVRGTVTPAPPAGSRLELTLKGRTCERSRCRCVSWTAAGRPHRISCRRAALPRSIAPRPRWRIALPRGLPAGRYRLTARLRDPSGRRERVDPGRNRVEFRIRTRR